MIGEPDVRISHLVYKRFVAKSYCARINITWDQAWHQTAAKIQSSDTHLYCLDIERVCFVNNRRVRNSFASNQQVTSFRFLFSFPVTMSVFQTILECVLLVFLRVGYSPHSHFQADWPLWMLMI